MSDDDLLRGYRPAGPPPDLRARVMSRAKASAERFSLRDWLPALAAAALIAMCSALSYRLHDDMAARVYVPDDLRPVEQWLPDDTGGMR